MVTADFSLNGTLSYRPTACYIRKQWTVFENLYGFLNCCNNNKWKIASNQFAQKGLRTVV